MCASSMSWPKIIFQMLKQFIPLQVECESSHCSESSLAPTHSACLVFVISKINVPIILIPQCEFGFLLIFLFFFEVLSLIEAIEPI